MLCTLIQLGINVTEVRFSKERFTRLVNQRLNQQDLDYLTTTSNKHLKFPSEYLLQHHSLDGDHLNNYIGRLPLSLIHPSFRKLIFKLFSHPSDALRDAYTIMETRLSNMSNSDQKSTKLINHVLNGNVGEFRLRGEKRDAGENSGARDFLKGIFQLHRNPRMHQAANLGAYATKADISEFLVVNHAMSLIDSLVKNDDANITGNSKQKQGQQNGT